MDEMNLSQLVVEYIEIKTKGEYNESMFRNNLLSEGYHELEVEEIIHEFEFEWEREEYQRVILRRALIQSLIGGFVTLIAIVVTLLIALRIIPIEIHLFVLFLIIGLGLLLIFSAITEFIKENKRKKRRTIKWSAWKSTI
jgi:hypothetical protein